MDAELARLRESAIVSDGSTDVRSKLMRIFSQSASSPNASPPSLRSINLTPPALPQLAPPPLLTPPPPPLPRRPPHALRPQPRAPHPPPPPGADVASTLNDVLAWLQRLADDVRGLHDRLDGHDGTVASNDGDSVLSTAETRSAPAVRAEPPTRAALAHVAARMRSHRNPARGLSKAELGKAELGRAPSAALWDLERRYQKRRELER